VTFSVLGDPAPQGSKRHVGKGIMVESSKAVKPWRDSVAWSAKARMTGQFAGAIKVTITFYLRRGRSVKRHWPSVRPDLDKLIRSTLDGITMSGLWLDDAQVCHVDAMKFYTGSISRVEPGAVIIVEEL